MSPRNGPPSVVRLLALAQIVLVCGVAGCAYIGETPTPGAEPTAAPSGVAALPTAVEPTVPLATPSPLATETQSAMPTADQSTPSPEPMASVPVETPVVIGDVWHRSADFPPDGAEVTAIVATDSGFYAAGTVPMDSGQCDADDGRIWFSADGNGWSTVAELRGAYISNLVQAGGDIYAFGDSYCDSSEGIQVWRSAGDASWERTAIPVQGEQYVTTTGALGNQLIALGEGYTKDYHVYGVVWTSMDGANWQRSASGPMPGVVGYSTVTGAGDIAIAPDSYSERPFSYSLDRGRTWQISDYRPGAFVQPHDAVAAHGLFVAIAGVCCTTPNTDAGLILHSSDGHTWHESQAFAGVPDDIVALDAGFLALGDQSWFSADSKNWSLAAPLPRVHDWQSVVAAGNADTLVAISGRFTWTASVADLLASVAPEGPDVAARPVIGASYEVSVFTHCGWPDTHFDLRTWVPDPPIDDINPPEGIKEFDHGRFTFVSENRLQYQAERGRVVELVPSDVVHVSGPCA